MTECTAIARQRESAQVAHKHRRQILDQPTLPACVGASIAGIFSGESRLTCLDVSFGLVRLGSRLNCYWTQLVVQFDILISTLSLFDIVLALSLQYV